VVPSVTSVTPIVAAAGDATPSTSPSPSAKRSAAQTAAMPAVALILGLTALAVLL
jgi:hypothetical protein